MPIEFFKVFNALPSFSDKFRRGGQTHANPYPNYGFTGGGRDLESYFNYRMRETPAGGADKLVAYVPVFWQTPSMTAMTESGLTDFTNYVETRLTVTAGTDGYGLLDFRGSPSWNILTGDGTIGPSNVQSTNFIATRTSAEIMLEHFRHTFPRTKWSFAGLPYIPQVTQYAPNLNGTPSWAQGNATYQNTGVNSTNYWDSTHPRLGNISSRLYPWYTSPQDLKSYFYDKSIGSVQSILERSDWYCPDITPIFDHSGESREWYSIEAKKNHTQDLLYMIREYTNALALEDPREPIKPIYAFVNNMYRSRAIGKYDDETGVFQSGSVSLSLADSSGQTGVVVPYARGYTGVRNYAVDKLISENMFKGGMLEPAAYINRVPSTFDPDNPDANTALVRGCDGFVYLDQIPFALTMANYATDTSTELNSLIQRRARNFVAREFYGYVSPAYWQGLLDDNNAWTLNSDTPVTNSSPRSVYLLGLRSDPLNSIGSVTNETIPTWYTIGPGAANSGIRNVEVVDFNLKNGNTGQYEVAYFIAHNSGTGGTLAVYPDNVSPFRRTSYPSGATSGSPLIGDKINALYYRDYRGPLFVPDDGLTSPVTGASDGGYIGQNYDFKVYSIVSGTFSEKIVSQKYLQNQHFAKIVAPNYLRYFSETVPIGTNDTRLWTFGDENESCGVTFDGITFDSNLWNSTNTCPSEPLSLNNFFDADNCCDYVPVLCCLPNPIGTECRGDCGTMRRDICLAMGGRIVSECAECKQESPLYWRKQYGSFNPETGEGWTNYPTDARYPDNAPGSCFLNNKCSSVLVGKCDCVRSGGIWFPDISHSVVVRTGQAGGMFGVVGQQSTALFTRNQICGERLDPDFIKRVVFYSPTTQTLKEFYTNPWAGKTVTTAASEAADLNYYTFHLFKQADENPEVPAVGDFLVEIEMIPAFGFGLIGRSGCSLNPVGGLNCTDCIKVTFPTSGANAVLVEDVMDKYHYICPQDCSKCELIPFTECYEIETTTWQSEDCESCSTANGILKLECHKLLRKSFSGCCSDQCLTRNGVFFGDYSFRDSRGNIRIANRKTICNAVYSTQPCLCLDRDRIIMGEEQVSVKIGSNKPYVDRYDPEDEGVLLAELSRRSAAGLPSGPREEMFLYQVRQPLTMTAVTLGTRELMYDCGRDGPSLERRFECCCANGIPRPPLSCMWRNSSGLLRPCETPFGTYEATALNVGYSLSKTKRSMIDFLKSPDITNNDKVSLLDLFFGPFNEPIQVPNLSSIADIEKFIYQYRSIRTRSLGTISLNDRYYSSQINENSFGQIPFSEINDPNSFSTIEKIKNMNQNDLFVKDYRYYPPSRTEISLNIVT